MYSTSLSAEDVQFIRDNLEKYSDAELGQKLSMPRYTIKNQRHKLKIYRLKYPPRNTPISDNLISLLEDFYCNPGKTVQSLSNKWGVSYYTATKHISYLIPLRLTEDTKMIVLQSKINY